MSRRTLYLIGGAAIGLGLTVAILASQTGGESWVCAYGEDCASLTDCPIAPLRADVTGQDGVATIAFGDTSYTTTRRVDPASGVIGYVSDLKEGEALFLTIQPNGASVLSIHYANPAIHPIATAGTYAGRCTEVA